MIRFKIFLFCLFVSTLVQAQRYVDYGLIGGASFYNGQLNPTNLFSNPSRQLGAFMRFNIDKRHAIRFSGYYLGLKGDAADYPELLFPTSRPLPFSKNSVFDISLQFEFNFLPYITGEDPFLQSLYVAGGIGYSAGGTDTGIIPFGLGYKINLTERLSAGAEWSFRKTFSDMIDNHPNELGKTPFNNNDWYSTLGLFISYKFFKFAPDCPVYN